MENLIHYITFAGFSTKIFIGASILILAVLQRVLCSFSFKFVSIPVLHVVFGVLLSKVSLYHPLVHLVVYIAPSLLILGILLILIPVKKPAQYNDPLCLSYKTNKGNLMLNPFAGVCILGVPKAGKTASIVKPTIEQLALKNYCGAIYDYKKWDLTKVAYYHYENHPVVDFKMFNPFDLNYSVRLNPINPNILQHPAYAMEASMVFLANMMGASKGQGSSDRYWIESAAGVLAGVIWRLREDYPEMCDLPHAIAIVINKPMEELTEFLKKNDQSVFLAASYFKSIVSEKQVAGILGTLASSLSKVALPEIFYLLSGNEVDLELNHPDHPTLLTLSTVQQLDKTYAPVLALIISMSLKLMNQEGRHHSAIVLDEAPTLIVPEFDRIPATARSNKIATFFIAQDMVQGEDGYGRIGRDKILATLSTHLYGKVTDPNTAERYSKMFGTVDKYYTSKSRKAGAWSNSGYTDSLREIRKYKPEKFHQLETGEFLGVIADGNMKEFNARFACYQEKPVQLPMVRNITKYEVEKVFNRIIDEAREI